MKIQRILFVQSTKYAIGFVYYNLKSYSQTITWLNTFKTEYSTKFKTTILQYDNSLDRFHSYHKQKLNTA